MQIREAAAREWAAAERLKGFASEHLLDPGTNTMAGTWYLQKLLKRYDRTDNPLPYTLADYNAGRGNVLKWSAVRPAPAARLLSNRSVFPAQRIMCGR